MQLSRRDYFLDFAKDGDAFGVTSLIWLSCIAAIIFVFAKSSFVFAALVLFTLLIAAINHKTKCYSFALYLPVAFFKGYSLILEDISQSVGIMLMVGSASLVCVSVCVFLVRYSKINQ
jgi:hypothetical protein